MASGSAVQRRRRTGTQAPGVPVQATGPRSGGRGSVVEQRVDLAQVQEENLRLAASHVAAAPGRASRRRDAGGTCRRGAARRRGELVEDRSAAPSMPPRLVDAALLHPVEPAAAGRAAPHTRTAGPGPARGGRLPSSAGAHPVVQGGSGRNRAGAAATGTASPRGRNRQVPVPVLRRGVPGQQRGDGARAVAEHRAQRLPVGQHIREEVAAVQHAPAQAIDRGR